MPFVLFLAAVFVNHLANCQADLLSFRLAGSMRGENLEITSWYLILHLSMQDDAK